MAYPIEWHVIERIGWLRAAVLGANDGIVSTASLIVGVAAAASAKGDIMLAGMAGLVAGAMSMAAGEFVSVSSQSDAEAADLARERHEHDTMPDAELTELAEIYQARGLNPELAMTVARQLTEFDAMGAHARDELGINMATKARPVQAAIVSALTFAAGAAVPLIVAAITPLPLVMPVVAAASIAGLMLLGGVGAQAGGARLLPAIARVTFWGGAAMAATALIGKLFGTAVA